MIDRHATGAHDEKLAKVRKNRDRIRDKMLELVQKRGARCCGNANITKFKSLAGRPRGGNGPIRLCGEPRAPGWSLIRRHKEFG